MRGKSFLTRYLSSADHRYTNPTYSISYPCNVGTLWLASMTSQSLRVFSTRTVCSEPEAGRSVSSRTWQRNYYKSNAALCNRIAKANKYSRLHFGTSESIQWNCSRSRSQTNSANRHFSDVQYPKFSSGSIHEALNRSPCYL